MSRAFEVSRPTIGEADWDQVSAPVVHGGGLTVVFWQGQGGIRGSRIAPDGSLLDRLGFLVSTKVHPYDIGYLDAAWNGSAFLVVWSTDAELLGVRVTPDGGVLDEMPIPIVPNEEGEGGASVAWNGQVFLVTWERSSVHSEKLIYGLEKHVYGTRVTAEGTVLDPTGFLISESEGYQSSSTVASLGANFIVAWTTNLSGGSDVAGARVSNDGTVLDRPPIPISSAPEGQFSPELASDGTNALAVWHDLRSGDYDPEAFGARITPAGTVVDPEGIRLAGGPGGGAFSRSRCGREISTSSRTRRTQPWQRSGSRLTEM